MAEINTTQMRDALAWLTNDREKQEDPSTNPFEWLGGAAKLGNLTKEKIVPHLVLLSQISEIEFTHLNLRDN
ncbi:hypothetical protein [Pseudoduganella albidiflava]|uniref:Uncharacterized protein n=1 Tax=Pseudoduganella albidiflava TaxID=321983 RepID=A0A411X198_9BURK|nr:hypothetical protein [Pseudoduganella albidiflava]QBI02740.1 hypothetical protein EYF70_19210 [Pseudoduganella albidiflava]GGY55908.1 hypothetical protein GCM10007387_42910 [Pseudoduganella albidiflava]